MELRLARKEDLKELEKMFSLIVQEMRKNGIYIWNEYYPFEEFENDIDNNRLYLLIENDDICSAFALFDNIEGNDCFNWENKQSKCKYLGRLGVNINYMRKGVASKTINYAKNICKNNGIEYLRLTVVEENLPAISLYEKNGFNKKDGIYKEYSPSLDKTIREIAFEIKI